MVSENYVSRVNVLIINNIKKKNKDISSILSKKQVTSFSVSSLKEAISFCKKGNIDFALLGIVEDTINKSKFEKLINKKKIHDLTTSEKKLVSLIKKEITDNYNNKIKKVVLENFYEESATSLAISMAYDTRTSLYEKVGIMNHSPALSKIKNSLFSVYVNGKVDEKVSEDIFNKIIHENFFPVIKKNTFKRAKKLLSHSRKLKRKNYEKVSSKELKKLFIKFHKLFTEMRNYTSLPTSLEHNSQRWSKHLEKVLSKKVKDKEELNKALSLLTTPDKISYVKEFELEIAKIGLKKSLKKNISKDIDKLLNKFAWINYTFEGDAINKKYISDEIKKLGKTSDDFKKIITDNKKRIKDLKKERKELIKKIGLNKEEKKLFNIGKDIVFIKFFRKGTFAESYYNVEFLLFEIGKRLGIEKKLMVNMLPHEIITAIDINYFPKEVIKERIRNGFLFHDMGITYGSHELRWKEKKSDEKISEELKGQVAFQGKAKGKVKIVNAIKDLKKFNQGDILVSRSTNPTLVPAIKKAAAIVTDLGGLTCHAAIVAREMKKPCVVGTNNATKILKDNDLVEVDANKGIVKKVK